ncbi:sulfatase-like hydrolase/transferase [Tamlana sp. 1_MG-2023]|uniref:sulfatase-like hydrolase/transferase n=1 Tax=Tamlana sp. 1_MG-2023 TaxID=3062628 RepID=UPI0026E2545C|nr:sulfatase-like hydrolase/transferase [Tamlana sp. 1_MG-2023]MDO6792068.1 sulfatase-like hydrolase/transferase [Tamlana sp. 1_MG-2023]
MKVKLRNNKVMFKNVLFLIVTLSLFGLQSCDSQIKEEKKPNIIFFFTDDQSYDTQRDFGNKVTKTPNLDVLADNGVVFSRHYNTTAICMASRANVMTGQFEYKTGCNFDHGSLGTKQWSTSYPVLLREAGYRVGFAGKFGFSISDTNEGWGEEGEVAKHDFDFWGGGSHQTSYKTIENKYMAKYAAEYPHSTRAYGAASIDFINESVEKDEPFCMSVYFKAPHRPVEPDPMFDDVYKDVVFDKLPNYGREAGEHLAKQSRMGRQYPRFVEWGYSEEDTYQEALRKYNQLIYGVDYSIGMVLEQLKKLNIDDNTIIIFSSDNGYFNGSHGLGSKVLPYEEGARTPLIIVDPRQNDKGQRTSALTGNVDITATILDYAGVAIPSIYDGKSIRPLVENPKGNIRPSLPIIQVWGPKATHCLTVMDDKYKYIYWYYKDESKNIYPTEELFDIVNDPYEMKNIASESKYRSELIKMRKLYDKQLEHWKKEGVKYNGYKKYVSLFERKLN